MASQQFSRATHERLTAELYDLTTRGRIEVAQKIEAARLMGDLSENGDYHAAKDEQGHMEGRIRHLEHLLDEAIVVEQLKVMTILYDGDDEDDAETYIIGHQEEKTGAIEVMSPKSPLGTELVDANAGDTVEFTAPHGGKLKVRVLKVEFA